jgi:hypothetical protein
MHSSVRNDVDGGHKKTKKLRLVGIILAAVATILVLACLKAPDVARWYIMRTYKEVEYIASLDIHLNGTVDMWDVIVRKPGLGVEVEHVFADYHKNIIVERGWVTLDLDQFEPPKSSGEKKGPGPNIIIKDIIIKVKKGSNAIEVNGANYDGKKVCWKNGLVQTGFALSKDHEVHAQFLNIALKHGCVDKETRIVVIDKASAKVTLPFEIPRMEGSYRAELVNAAIQIKKMSIEAGAFSLFGKDKEPVLNLSKLNVTIADDHIDAFVDTVTARHPWLSDSAYQVHDVRAHLPREPGTMQVNFGYLDIGKVKVVLDQEHRGVMAEGKCADWLDTLSPVSWWTPETRAKTKGEFSFSVQAVPPKMKLKSKCSIECSLPAFASLKKRFTYTAYDKNKKPLERESGPRSATWTPLSTLPEHVQKAFVTLEDPGFERHRGVIRQALLNSLKDNLRAGRFVRGGSTITMQLVKNLWLGREKTLDRKIKEIILATMLERCLSKYEILELYLNVIEFGPNLYGIGPASREYFSMVPANLRPDEALYLARLLPRPARAVRPEEGGMERIHKLMDRLKENGLLPDELEIEGLDDEPTERPEENAPPTGEQPAVRSEQPGTL